MRFLFSCWIGAAFVVLPVIGLGAEPQEEAAYSACAASLAKVAKKSAKPFVISVYSLFNDRMPWRYMKYPDDYFRDQDMDRYGVPTKLQRSDIHPSCLENIDYQVEKRYDAMNSVVTGLDKAQPISVMQYDNRYYLSLFDWSYLDFDDIGDVVSMNVVIFDIARQTMNFVPNASVWITVEGCNTIVDMSVTGSAMTMTKSFYCPETTADGELIGDADGRIPRYIKMHDPYVVGEYEMDSQGALVEKLKFDRIDLLK
ncbi:MAG: hypothetical protein LBC37_04070 [Zoogloeaceae bacterium]|jgi:hypothetical protein|nr:hypothetical protein [Zoogloeaceae bacterium]